MAEEQNSVAVADVNGDISQATPEGAEAVLPEQLKVENAVLQEKLKHSSEQGIRVAEDLKELKAELAKLKSSSLTKEQQQPGFVDEAQYVQWWMAEGDLTEKQARAQYKRDFHQESRLEQLLTGQRALQNMVKFEREQSEKGLVNLNAEAKEANAFWADNPVMDALPIADKIEYMNKQKAKLPPSGKDLSSIKNAASGATGGSGAAAASGASNGDAEAKALGFPSKKAMDEMSKCTTQAEYQDYKKRWKLK